MAKVTDKELADIKELRESFLKIIQRVGEANLEKLLIEKELADCQEQFFAIREREKGLLKAITEKYGAGEIDVDTGEIASSV